MTDVHLLYHRHDLGDGHEGVKLIGVYSSLSAAEAAQARAAQLPVFAETPEGFEIHAQRLDADNWRDGYVTVSD